MLPISAVIITLNEEQNIDKCILSLTSVCSEIVVIDSGSSDNTTEIAKRYGAKVVAHEWRSYGHARNLGAEFASHDMILSIDADECLSNELAKNILKTKISENRLYQLHRLNHYKNSWIYHGHLFPEWKERLYNRKLFKWNDAQVHERLVKNALVKVIKLPGDLYHYRAHDVIEWKSKYEKYGYLAAKEWQLQGYTPSVFKKYLSPYYHFVYSFIFRFGFLDLRIGWELAYHKYYATMKKIEAFEKLS